ncbi:ShlB/FhaC/HecB family hemolysin secretion/activation protein [Pelomonas sp. KK5]|uniref:ShlB/FhaC/HecB family hemolysin secretion/activation protein n=1 Tax=Pelomonas sp. KK5 TaxID=1855730 RepID=UPI00117C2060|nr:ShlB/FhaC/HecB family hemolysin secretion/activation protein [Pelomonas sp. KK5]
MKSWIQAALAAALLWVASPTLAQPAGRIDQDMRPPPEPVRRDSLRIAEPAFGENVPAGAETLQFTLGDVQLSGNRTISTDALRPLWADKLGRTVTLAEVFHLAARVGARYREAGYILSQAIVPAQDIGTAGPAVVQIQVLEGYVDRVTFSGFESPGLAERLAPVTAERPLRLATLERAMLLVNELAGISAQANIRAGEAPNSSELIIVAARTPSAYSLLLHNRTAPAQGHLRLEAGVELRGLAGAFDRHALRLVSSGDRRLNMLAYNGEAPLGAQGLKALWSASDSRSKPDSPLPNIDTDSTNVQLGLSYPVLRSRRSNLELRAVLNGYDNRTGEGELSRERIRALRLGLTADHADDLDGITLLDLEASAGITGLGASPAGDPRLNGARPDFRRLTLYAARLQSLGGDWSLLLALTAQHANERMPVAEQLGLGGEVFLRGFDPSEAIGERGYAGKAELRCNALMGSFSTTWYGFVDAGRVRRLQVGAPTLSTALASFGLGVRFSGPFGSKGYIEVAKPQRKDVASQGDRDARLFAGLGADF